MFFETNILVISNFSNYFKRFLMLLIFILNLIFNFICVCFFYTSVNFIRPLIFLARLNLMKGLMYSMFSFCKLTIEAKKKFN